MRNGMPAREYVGAAALRIAALIEQGVHGMNARDGVIDVQVPTLFSNDTPEELVMVLSQTTGGERNVPLTTKVLFAGTAAEARRAFDD